MEHKTYMIIDDDEDDRFFFREALAELCPLAVCLEASDGARGLELLRRTEQLPDFVFLDVNMPRMNGRECLKELKRDEKLRGIIVIMYSTSFSEQTIKEFGELGAAAYFKKPININQLPGQIMEAVQKSVKLSL